MCECVCDGGLEVQERMCMYIGVKVKGCVSCVCVMCVCHVCVSCVCVICV